MLARRQLTNIGDSTRPGIDQQPPDTYLDMLLGEQLEGGPEALARSLAIIERGRPAWHDHAACRGSRHDFTNTRSAANASQCFDRCGRCPVRAECLQWALAIGDDQAILGGTDPETRRRMRATREAIA